MPNNKRYPVASMRRDRKIVLTEDDIKFAESLPDAPSVMRIKVDNRANKYKKRIK